MEKVLSLAGASRHCSGHTGSLGLTVPPASLSSLTPHPICFPVPSVWTTAPLAVGQPHTPFGCNLHMVSHTTQSTWQPKFRICSHSFSLDCPVSLFICLSSSVQSAVVPVSRAWHVGYSWTDKHMSKEAAWRPSCCGHCALASFI
jgi:hypothetical protein